MCALSTHLVSWLLTAVTTTLSNKCGRQAGSVDVKNKLFLRVCDLVNRVCKSIGLCACGFLCHCRGSLPIIRRKRLCNCILPVQAGRERGEERWFQITPLHPIRFYYNNRLVCRSTDVTGKTIVCFVTTLTIHNSTWQLPLLCKFMFVPYLEDSYSRKRCPPSGRKCLHSGMVTGCMADRGSRSAGLCTLEDNGSDTSPPHSRIRRHWDRERESGHTRLHPACRFDQ